MNLVCKEYIASKIDKTGVLILSEMAGASKELSDALLINPNNVSLMADTIYQALTMPEEAQIVHLSLMQAILKHYNIHHWFSIFMNRLNHVLSIQNSMESHRFDLQTREMIFGKFKRAKKRLLFLDYDGTLIGFFTDPNAAKPDAALIGILKKLAADERNRVIIISGRDRGTLDRWLGSLPISIVAEHGVWLRMKKGNWESMAHLQGAWKNDFRPVLETYVDRTPGSFIEEKDFSLVWHFRKVEAGLGELRSRELTSHLKYLTSGKNLNVLEGDMVVELKNADVNKGIAAQRWLSNRDAGFVMAIGDDWTDEDTFKAMPENSVTIKVGSTTSSAKYNIPSVKEVRSFLKSLTEY
jgi:trehalose 6-phosphate synthase/phosphatase